MKTMASIYLEATRYCPLLEVITVVTQVIDLLTRFRQTENIQLR
jgi:hypothetical protein